MFVNTKRDLPTGIIKRLFVVSGEHDILDVIYFCINQHVIKYSNIATKKWAFGVTRCTFIEQCRGMINYFNN